MTIQTTCSLLQNNMNTSYDVVDPDMSIAESSGSAVNAADSSSTFALAPSESPQSLNVALFPREADHRRKRVLQLVLLPTQQSESSVPQHVRGYGNTGQSTINDRLIEHWTSTAKAAWNNHSSRSTLSRLAAARSAVVASIPTEYAEVHIKTYVNEGAYKNAISSPEQAAIGYSFHPPDGCLQNSTELFDDEVDVLPPRTPARGCRRRGLALTSAASSQGEFSHKQATGPVLTVIRPDWSP